MADSGDIRAYQARGLLTWFCGFIMFLFGFLFTSNKEKTPKGLYDLYIQYDKGIILKTA